MENITYDDFKKLDIRIGLIKSAEKVENADKLLKLEVEIGLDTRTLVAGIAESYTAESVIGLSVPVLSNLEPRSIRGIESQGMILAVNVDGRPVLLNPISEVPSGSLIS